MQHGKWSPEIGWYYSSLAPYVVPVSEGVEECTMVYPKLMVKFLIKIIIVIII